MGGFDNCQLLRFIDQGYNSWMQKKNGELRRIIEHKNEVMMTEIEESKLNTLSLHWCELNESEF